MVGITEYTVSDIFDYVQRVMKNFKCNMVVPLAVFLLIMIMVGDFVDTVL